LLRYLDFRPARRDTDALFLRACAPLHQPLSSQAISSIVARSTRRAGVITPVKGAHVLRHSAATEMLRSGLSLDEIRTILRHRSVETTAHYAKVDLPRLRQVVQPWPEVNPC
jgi:site-specific recombinase XerD